jgi:hypothetical protein
MEATPGQLVFGRDMIYGIEHKANWEYIRQKKQKSIDYSNKRENSKRIAHKYKVGDKVLLKNDAKKIKRKFEDEYLGPYTILEVHNNGNVTIDRGAFEERVHIRRVIPYHDQE